MSKRQGTAETRFKPLYVAGDNAEDFENRVWRNQVVATAGAAADRKYLKARVARFAWQVLKIKEAQIEKEPGSPHIDGWKAVAQRARNDMNKFFDDAFETKDWEGISLLSEVLKNAEPVSNDALLLINFCSSKPYDYVFTFKEMLQAYTSGMGMKPPIDEAVEQRVRRLIKTFGVRIRKRQ